jgi:hypothetical protein
LGAVAVVAVAVWVARPGKPVERGDDANATAGVSAEKLPEQHAGVLRRTFADESDETPPRPQPQAVRVEDLEASVWNQLSPTERIDRTTREVEALLADDTPEARSRAATLLSAVRADMWQSAGDRERYRQLEARIEID